MARATSQVFAHTDALVKVWPLAAAAEKNTLVVNNGVIGITLTRTTGVAGADEIEVGPYTVSRPKFAGVGNDKATAVGPIAAGVALDGTWEFEGVVSTGTTAVPTTTAQGTPVFVTSAGDLTLVNTSNTRAGIVNYPATYNKVAGKLPIAIGL